MTPTNLARAGSIAQQPDQSRQPPRVRPLEVTTPKREQAAEPKHGSARRTVVLVAIIAPLVAISVVGAPYYLSPLAERVRSPLHAWLRPSGYVGQSAGILALGIFVFLWLYPLRKKWKALAFTGSVGKWLDVHVTSALALPLLLGVHAAWRSEGLIGLGLMAMLVVIASGIIGRYIYTRIPRTKSGVEFTREEVAAERAKLVEQLALTTGLAPDVIRGALDVAPPPDRDQNAARSFLALMTNDLMRWRRTRELRRRWKQLAPANRPLSAASLRYAVDLASREISLSQQSRMLAATHRVFRYLARGPPAVCDHGAHRRHHSRRRRDRRRRNLVPVGSPHVDAPHDAGVFCADGPARPAPHHVS